MANISFLRRAQDDIFRYERWRNEINLSWDPIADEIAKSIVEKLRSFHSYHEVPYGEIIIKGHKGRAKRVLVEVRSKLFKVYILPGGPNEIRIFRVRHPSQRPIEE